MGTMRNFPSPGLESRVRRSDFPLRGSRGTAPSVSTGDTGTVSRNLGLIKTRRMMMNSWETGRPRPGERLLERSGRSPCTFPPDTDS
ncbi:hypothetical protein T261_2094 [Streptomyces lydicus]|nr:hypothetical protein T261_2094 [Streptomyces lydicus]